jgi:hypothetical protein
LNNPLKQLHDSEQRGPIETTKMLGKMNTTSGKTAVWLRSWQRLRCGLGSAQPQRIGKLAERVSDRRAKALCLHEHADKWLTKTTSTRSAMQAPRVQAPFSRTLFTVDSLELLGQRWRSRSDIVG